MDLEKEVMPEFVTAFHEGKNKAEMVGRRSSAKQFISSYQTLLDCSLSLHFFKYIPVHRKFSGQLAKFSLKTEASPRDSINYL